MSFRSRMVLASLVVGVFAVFAASLGAYLAARNALINSTDEVRRSCNLRVMLLAGIVCINQLQSTVSQGFRYSE